MVAISGMADSSLVTNSMAFLSLTNCGVLVKVQQVMCIIRSEYLQCISTLYAFPQILLSRPLCAFHFSLSARFYLRICCFPDLPIQPLQSLPGLLIVVFHIQHPGYFERANGKEIVAFPLLDALVVVDLREYCSGWKEDPEDDKRGTI